MVAEAIIKLATTEDSRDIWSWRNDIQTRAMSITTGKISWESHSSWFKQSLLNPNRFLYVGWLAEEDKIGMCRFDIDNAANIAEISIILTPSMRGKNLSHILVAGAIKVFQLSNSIPLNATIKKQNIASIKCFTKCGFVFDREDEEFNYYVLNT